ncbi:hypothetical protein HNQ03_000570 [Chryseobacterium sp. 16F]|uniref:Uncharacterized protein n=1 Tax=Frigoriflavimonas asaccharolytica TaxID=2735899 RepID=A0A8J8K707_9FLAO|nr:hypothetical protein [Frigoriflavimonas asaccharolytica]
MFKNLTGKNYEFTVKIYEIWILFNVIRQIYLHNLA